jgi:hypothetical protein
MFAPALEWAQQRYQADLAKQLSAYGLRTDDLMDPMLDTVRRPPASLGCRLRARAVPGAAARGGGCGAQAASHPRPRSFRGANAATPCLQDVAEALRRLPADVVVARNQVQLPALPRRRRGVRGGSGAVRAGRGWRAKRTGRLLAAAGRGAAAAAPAAHLMALCCCPCSA